GAGVGVERGGQIDDAGEIDARQSVRLRLQHHHRDLARGPAAIVGIIPVGVLEPRPERLELGADRPPRANRAALAARLYARLGPRLEVEPPRRRAIVAALAAHHAEVVALPHLEQ